MHIKFITINLVTGAISQWREGPESFFQVVFDGHTLEKDVEYAAIQIQHFCATRLCVQQDTKGFVTFVDNRISLHKSHNV